MTLPRCAIHGTRMVQKTWTVSGTRQVFYLGDQRKGGEPFSELITGWVCDQCPPKQLEAKPVATAGPSVIRPASSRRKRGSE